MGYTDPALTAALFDDDGWYRTEDIGVLDDAGYLIITDRKKDVIIRGGENISAVEVEEQLDWSWTGWPRWRWWPLPTPGSASRPARSCAWLTASADPWTWT